MHKIEVFRTHIEINDYKMKDSYRLERFFSIYDPIRHKYFYKAMYYDKDNKRLYIPRGLDLSFLANIFREEPYMNTDIDPVFETGPIRIKYLPRDKEQEEAISFMIAQGKYSVNKEFSMLSVNLNTGKGKTYCSIATMAYFQYKSIIITDSTSILKQWKSFILQYTDIKEDEIFIITGSTKFLYLLNSPPKNKYKIFLCSHSTIQSVASQHGWPTIGILFAHLGIGLKFYDEAHLDFDNMFMIDCFTNSLITYYITATPGRSNDTEDSIYYLYFKNVPSINLFNAISDPHTQYIGIKYNSHPTAVEIENCMGSYGLNRSLYTKYAVDRENFHYILHILIQMAHSHKGKCLWYIGTNESILKVRDWIYENYPDLIGLVGIYTTLTPAKDKESQLNKKIILSTTKSAGAAVDIKDLVMTVVLAEPFKSKIIAQQTFGRTRGDNTIYIDIVDTGFKTLVNHYNQKKPIFRKYATDCSEIVLKDSDLKSRAEDIIEKRKNLINPIIFEDPDL